MGGVQEALLAPPPVGPPAVVKEVPRHFLALFGWPTPRGYREAEIFFQLKLRERRQNKLRPRLGVTDSNPALLRQLTSSLHQALNSQILQADICPYALDEILRSPYRISQEIDWLISTEEQAAQLELENLSPYQDKLLTVTLSLTAESLHIVEEKLHGALSRHEQAHTEEQEAAQ